MLFSEIEPVTDFGEGCSRRSTCDIRLPETYAEASLTANWTTQSAWRRLAFRRRSSAARVQQGHDQKLELSPAPGNYGLSTVSLNGPALAAA